MFINTKSDCILHILVFKYEKLGYLISLSLSLRQVKKFNCNLMWWQSIITGEFEPLITMTQMEMWQHYQT